MTINELAFNSNILSLGAILGTYGNQKLIDDINTSSGSGSFFGNIEKDPFHQGFQTFMNTIIEPIRQNQFILENVSAQLKNPNTFRAITSTKDLRVVPPCMQLGIVYYAPVRQMLEEERIDGYGINPKSLEENDPYEDMIKSGKWVGNSADIKGEWSEVNFYEKSTDPDLSFEEIRCLDQTRQFLDKFMSDEETKHLDPTDPTNLHG